MVSISPGGGDQVRLEKDKTLPHTSTFARAKELYYRFAHNTGQSLSTAPAASRRF